MTGRHSVRAQAQEIYGELSAKADAARVTQTPTLTLPLSGGGNENANAVDELHHYPLDLARAPRRHHGNAAREL
jgi:hypothetical protein